jgi:hypothetical protein
VLFAFFVAIAFVVFFAVGDEHGRNHQARKDHATRLTKAKNEVNTARTALANERTNAPSGGFNLIMILLLGIAVAALFGECSGSRGRSRCRYCSVRRADGEHRTVGHAHDALRDTSQQGVRQTGMPVGADHDHV